MKQNFTNLLSLLTRPNVNNLFLPHYFFVSTLFKSSLTKRLYNQWGKSKDNFELYQIDLREAICDDQFSEATFYYCINGLCVNVIRIFLRILQDVSNEFFAHLPTKLCLNENFAPRPKSMMLAELECLQRFLFKYFNFFSCLLSTLLVFQLYPFRF